MRGTTSTNAGSGGTVHVPYRSRLLRFDEDDHFSHFTLTESRMALVEQLVEGQLKRPAQPSSPMNALSYI